MSYSDAALIPVEPFHQRLRRLRETRDMTLKDVATRTGVALTTYREWEHGRAIQGLPYERLSEALGVSLSELITGRTADKGWILKELQLIENSIQSLKEQLLNQI